MTDYALKALKLTIGSILILLGILGTLLPVIPGTPLLIVGLALLGVRYEQLKKWGWKIRDYFKKKKEKF